MIMKLFAVLVVINFTIGFGTIIKPDIAMIIAADGCFRTAATSRTCLSQGTALRLSMKYYRKHGGERRYDDLCLKTAETMSCIMDYAKKNCLDSDIKMATTFVFYTTKLNESSTKTTGCKKVYDANQDLY